MTKRTLSQIALLSVIGVLIAYITYYPDKGAGRNLNLEATSLPADTKVPAGTGSQKAQEEEHTAKPEIAETAPGSHPQQLPRTAKIVISEEKQPILGQSLHTREIKVSGEDEHVRDLEFVFRPGILPNRLFKHTEHIILKYDQLHKNDVGHGAMTVRFYFEIITADNNSDGLLSSADKREIGISYPDGSNYTKLISGVDEVISHEYMPVDNALVLTMQIDDQIVRQTYSMETYQPLYN